MSKIENESKFPKDWLCHFILVKKIAVADPGFPRGGGANILSSLKVKMKKSIGFSSEHGTTMRNNHIFTPYCQFTVF